jgi:GNAT superfamily N-acetyltransferase
LNYLIKQLNSQNIDALMQLEEGCFSDDLNRDKDSYIQVAMVYPKGAALLYIFEMLVGSLFFYPTIEGEVKDINLKGMSLTGDENCMYLYSLSIHPGFRGRGLSKILLDHYNRVSIQEGYNAQALVAIENSAEFWMKYGFKPVRQFMYCKAWSNYMIKKTN